MLHCRDVEQRLEHPGAAALRSPWVTFTICSLALFLTTLDLSIVNVAFPDILADFDISRADASWIVTSYNIFYGSLLLVSGKVADQFGRRRMFLLGLGVFAAGSAIAAVAPGLGVLIVGRAVQGIGGAMIAPASLGLLLAAFPLERRTQVIAMWGGIGALGIASGPSLGALRHLAHRLASSVLDQPADHRCHGHRRPSCPRRVAQGRERASSRLRRRAADHRGAGAAGARDLALGGVGLGRPSNRGHDRWPGLLPIPIFVRRQRRHPEPILDLALFDSRSFTVANISALTFMGAFAAYALNNVLFLRQAWGYSVLAAGLLTALPPVTVAVARTVHRSVGVPHRIPTIRDRRPDHRDRLHPGFLVVARR